VDGQLRNTKAGDMTVPILDWKDKVNRWPLKALHTPTLGPVSLLALSSLLEAGYEAHFTSTTIEIHRPGQPDRPVARGRRIANGLWLMNPLFPDAQAKKNANAPTTSSRNPSNAMAMYPALKNGRSAHMNMEINLFHDRHGHQGKHIYADWPATSTRR
jgi:hypothetical protein